MKPRRRTCHSRMYSPVRRALAVLVLVGYVLVLGGSSAGHGWHLLLHLLSEHHGGAHEIRTSRAAPVGLRHAALPARAEAEYAETSAHPHGSAHRHAHGSPPHRHAAASATASPDRDAHDARRSEEAPHEHDGHYHIHGSKQDQEQGAPALPTITLDKHCLFSGTPLPPPPARDWDGTRPTATLFSTAPPVEVPPPRWLG